MKIRTIYFKVPDMQKAVIFWQGLLGIVPHKHTSQWSEFMLDNVRLGILLNDFNDEFTGSNCVPVFEFKDEDVQIYVDRAKELGTKIIEDGLENPKLLSIVFKDPFGNEFELSKFHN